MAKERSAAQKEALRQAKEAAKAAGKEWSGLTKDEKREFRKQFRGTAKANVDEAKAAAQRDGRNWADLSKEQRQEYRKKTRQSVA